MRVPAERVQLPVLSTPAHGEGERLRAGWTRRFVAAPPRLDEMVALYESLGLEVMLEPLAACELDEDCASCLTASPTTRVVYTRGRK